ncbi:hypothetical protein BX600DRAFT_151889 [Xylariales sp. PMI_506]|nr:hypothetical protein BX600DRAFT_151889 [Xylariales sp. PMI_506]
MPSRRSHPKSHRGCKRCKSRRVKCDERKPECGNCIKYNAICDFIGEIIVPKTSPSSNVAGPALPMADLELLHNYVTSTCVTMTTRVPMREFYQTTVVQIGLENDYIMRVVLALSALHLAHQKPEKRDHYQSIAANYHSTASRTVLDLMKAVNSDTAPNLYLFSCLTTCFAIAPPRQDFRSSSGVIRLPDWLFLFQGVRTFHVHIPKETRHSGALAPLFSRGRSMRHARRAISSFDDGPPSQRCLRELLELIEQHVTDDNHKGIYAKSIEKLEISFAQMESGTSDPSSIFIWLFEMQEEFMPLLRIPTQEAVATLAYFTALFKYFPDTWWIDGCAEHLIQRIYALLDEEHRLWISWPMEQLSWVPPQDP